MPTPMDNIRRGADVGLLAPYRCDPKLRPYTITLVTRTSSPLASGRLAPGTGTFTETDFVIQNGNAFDGYAPIQYRCITEKDIALSGGALKDVKAILGPIVQPYGTFLISGGTDPILFDMPSSTSNTITTLYLRIQGPDYPSVGTLFKKFKTVSDKRTMFRLYVMNTGSE